ncbi:molybdopterin-dependent oxidoreductase [Salinarchaeum sp. IM2453]|uniref:molybdopterin-containing oxidoreductase family protein n=1 Tax=Salinarchaeum sp. IM2453 TaxID=2862870 RepID=UPI001C83D805|nr:molybdopterin-dependent oxidoreductase [Salinarchaeum sp. IM2453]QZA88606.1 molybdopterin-dependent oxidoreductase [Salinarchaeum sp. IM2453]
MTEKSVRRRRFLKGSVAGVAAAAAGCISLGEEPADAAADREAAYNNCWICRASCGQEVILEDRQPVDLTGVDGHPKSSAGPGTEGTLCSKGLAQLDKTYNPNRITRPYIREDGNLRASDWDEAIAYAAERLQSFREIHGPEKLLRYQGYPIGGDFHDLLFRDLYGAPVQVGRKTTCHGPFSDSWEWMAGYGREWPDWRNSEFIIAWGRNPMESFRGQWEPKGILEAINENDATLVCIDPRYTKTAEVADLWIPIRPRTDGALALAMGNVIIEKGLYDDSFVEDWTYGFDSYRDAVDDKTPEWAADITDVNSETIKELAIEFAKAAPKSVAFPFTGLSFQGNGFKNCQNVHALNGLVGCIDRKGGTRHWRSGFTLADPFEKRGIDVPANHEDRSTPKYDDYPYQRHIRDLSHNFVPTAVERGDIQGFVNNWSAPLKSGNSDAWAEALEAMDLVITVDAFWSGVSRRADVVFPGASTLEQPFLDTGGDSSYSKSGWVTASKAIIDPIENCRTDYEIYSALAEELGWGEYFPWEDATEYYDERLSGIGKSFDEVAEQSYEIVSDVEYEQWRGDGFDTETGKFQFDLDVVEEYESFAKDVGVSTAPEWRPPEGVYGETTDEEYPLLLTDGFVEQLSRGHCQALDEAREEYLDRYGFRNEEYDGNLLHINPDDAEPRGITTGDRVRVEATNGEVELVAHVYEGVRPGWLFTVAGFGEYSITPDQAGGNLMKMNTEQHVDPVTGMVDRNHPVKLERVGGDT